jgi:hypothetical protein
MFLVMATTVVGGGCVVGDGGGGGEVEVYLGCRTAECAVDFPQGPNAQAERLVWSINVVRPSTRDSSTVNSGLVNIKNLSDPILPARTPYWANLYRTADTSRPRPRFCSSKTSDGQYQLLSASAHNSPTFAEAPLFQNVPEVRGGMLFASSIIWVYSNDILSKHSSS